MTDVSSFVRIFRECLLIMTITTLNRQKRLCCNIFHITDLVEPDTNPAAAAAPEDAQSSSTVTAHPVTESQKIKSAGRPRKRKSGKVGKVLMLIEEECSNYSNVSCP